MFEKIAIGIKTFLRDNCLFNAIQGIRDNFPGAQMIIADCGEMTDEKDGIYADLIRDGHIVIELPFDAGFGRMSNAIVSRLERPYLLIGSDDFDFTADAAQGVLKLQATVEFFDVDIASGRVNNRPYEFLLTVFNGIKGTHVRELQTFIDPLDRKRNNRHLSPPPLVYDVDLTVNYNLIRKEVFEHPYNIRWDDETRIGGGEHGAMAYDCWKAGLRTVYVPGVNINEQQIRNSPRYKEYRNRANSPDRPCFVKRGIVEYVLGDGRIDYKA